MTVNVQDVVSQIRQALLLAEPDLDTTVGSVTRKIIDAISEPIASAYADQFLLHYQYDIDSKVGANLDDFAGVFGFVRLPARRSVGTVTFSRQTAATNNIIVPAGMQIATSGSPAIVFTTIVPSIMLTGSLSITIPVQAVVGGALGNVASNSIVRTVTPLQGITSFANQAATTGGADAESDDQLRARFKATIFRNLAGTEPMFLAIALSNLFVTQANVLGATKVHREQVQVVGHTAFSGIPDAKWVYPGTVTLGASIDTGQVATPGTDYTFNTDAGNVPATPSVHAVSTNVPDGIYDLEFEFVPISSRNDPLNGITNRIDLYINGRNDTIATESVVFDTGKLFSVNPNSPLYIGNFLRENGQSPESGNYFIPYTFGPVTEPSLQHGTVAAGTIVIGPYTYIEGIHYYLVNLTTAAGGTYTSPSGIELLSVANGNLVGIPATHTTFVVSYTFNSVPRDVSLATSIWRLTSTDVQVHQAKSLLLNVSLVAILSPGVSVATAQAQVFSALSAYISGVGFNGTVRVSDLIEVAHQVPGVVAVRISTNNDNALNYAIQSVSSTGAVLHTYSDTANDPGAGRAIDVLISDDTLPVLNAVLIDQRAPTTFSSALV